MTLPSHLHAFEGSLWDNRTNTVLRANYNKGHRNIKSCADLKSCLRNGAYTDLGGYPLYFVTSDGAALSFDAVRDNLVSVYDSIQNKIDDGWRVIGCDINYEDTELVCDHTGKPIPFAYGHSDEDEGSLATVFE